jgi:CDP-glycerol glycerophosphotransferase
MAKAVKETDADIACCGMWNERFNYKSQRFRKTKVYTSTHDKLKATYVGNGICMAIPFQIDSKKA